MENAELITRMPLKGDKRALEVRLTEKGLEKKKVVDEIFVSIENECFKGFSEQEKIVAKDFLTRMHKNMLDGEQKVGSINEKII
jgi:DNA-binding MarR family transcriptional regulator